MSPADARLFAEHLLAAADQAEFEGRDLTAADLTRFADVDTAARAELAAAIERAGG